MSRISGTPRSRNETASFSRSPDSAKKKTLVKHERDDGRFAPADAAEYERPRRVIRRRRVSGAIAPLQGASDCLRFRRAAFATLACPQKHFFTSFDFAVFFAFFALEKLRARGNPVRGNAFGEAARWSLGGVPKRKFPLKRFTEATGKSPQSPEWADLKFPSAVLNGKRDACLPSKFREIRAIRGHQNLRRPREKICAGRVPGSDQKVAPQKEAFL